MEEKKDYTWREGGIQVLVIGFIALIIFLFIFGFTL